MEAQSTIDFDFQARARPRSEFAHSLLFLEILVGKDVRRGADDAESHLQFAAIAERERVAVDEDYLVGGTVRVFMEDFVDPRFANGVTWRVKQGGTVLFRSIVRRADPFRASGLDVPERLPVTGSLLATAGIRASEESIGRNKELHRTKADTAPKYLKGSNSRFKATRAKQSSWCDRVGDEVAGRTRARRPRYTLAE